MWFVHACERVLVFVLHPASCPGLSLRSSTTWWGRVGGGRCEGIRQPVPSLPSSQRLTPCDLITWPLAATASLMLPAPTNHFASSKGNQTHLWEEHIRYVQYVEPPDIKQLVNILLWRAEMVPEREREVTVWPAVVSPNLTRTSSMFSPLNYTQPHNSACKVDITYQAV